MRNSETALKKLQPKNPAELKYYLQHLPRYRLTLSHIELAITGKTIADLGVIPGHMALACKQLGAAQVFGLDYDPKRFGFEEKLRSQGLEILKCDLEKAPLPLRDDCVDLILFTEVIEHLPTNADGVLSECRRVLKPGETLLLTTPNAKNLADRIRRLFGRATDSLAEDWGERLQQKHHREYTKAEMTAMLKNAGFKIQRQKYLPGTELAIFRGNFHSGLPKPPALTYAAIAYLIPPWRSYLLFLARKSN